MSRLYHLSPIGVGTEYIESLPSYISRLAEAHCVTPGALLRYEIIPLLNKQYYNYKGNISSFFHNQKKFDNSTPISAELVKVLEKTTLRKDLKYLTLHPISEIFSVNNVLNGKRAWCPKCFSDWKIEDKTIYEPLIWRFSLLKTCPIHDLPLQVICPNCLKEQKILTPMSKPGYCNYCRSWLGQAKEYKITTNKNSHEDQWFIKNIMELLSNVEHLNPELNKKFIIQNITELKKRIGSLEKFRMSLGIRGPNFKTWTNNTHNPNLNLVLKICYETNTDILSLMNNRQMNEPNYRIPKDIYKCYTKNKIDWQVCEKILKDVPYRDPLPPSHEVAKEIGCSLETIRNHFPELLNTIVFQRKIITTKEIEKRQEFLKDRIRKACLELHNEKIFPSQANVMKRIGAKYLFSRHGAKQIWLEVLIELGYVC